jgi:hypothetical protein
VVKPTVQTMVYTANMGQQLIVNETYIDELKNILSDAKNDKELFRLIVNAPFKDRAKAAVLGLGIAVLLLVDSKDKTINRIALSDTELAKGTINISVKPFRGIKIPLNYKGNSIAQAIRSGQYQQTSDWQYLFAPVLTPEEARLNQAGGGIACSFVYPLIGARSGGAIIFSYFITLDKIGLEHHNFMARYAKLASAALKKHV